MIKKTTKIILSYIEIGPPSYLVLLSMTPHFMQETVLQGQPPKPICEVTFFDMATGAQRLRAMAQVTQLINAGASYRGFSPIIPPTTEPWSPCLLGQKAGLGVLPPQSFVGSAGCPFCSNFILPVEGHADSQGHQTPPRANVP